MRDTAEEAAWARKTLGDRVQANEVAVEKEKASRTEWEEKSANDKSCLVRELAEIKQGFVALRGNERSDEPRRDQPRRDEPRRDELPRNEPRRDEPRLEERRQRVIVFADSNGHDTTAEEIKCHIQREQREGYDITVVQAFHLEDVYDMVCNHVIDITGAILVIDTLTNDARGTRRKQPLGPEELVCQADMLRTKTLGARATVFCQIKPMKHVNVVPHNKLLHEYLSFHDIYGCQTMIRAEYLRWDGFHISSQYKTVLHRQYACALLGVPVPCPTPFEDFLPGNVRHSYDQEWPALGTSRRGEVSNSRHGWSW